MKILIFLLWTLHLVTAQPEDVDSYTYCESCLTTAKAIEKLMKEATAESRQTVIESLISGGVCERLLFDKNQHSSKDMKSSCIHLLGNHDDQLRAALLNKEPKRLDLFLCYEQSTACIGVKRESFENSKSTFKNSDIDALLRENKENVCIARPVHAGSHFPSKDEL